MTHRTDCLVSFVAPAALRTYTHGDSQNRKAKEFRVQCLGSRFRGYAGVMRGFYGPSGGICRDLIARLPHA